MALLDHALIAPVLTAHPTEVRRKSMIDHRNRIAELMALQDRGLDETTDGDRIDEAILRQIALLWQTRPLRRERLFVADEVETALTYLRDVFLPALPALYARWERALGAAAAELPAARQLDRRRPRRQSLRHRRIAAARAQPRGARRCSAIISTRSTRSAPNCRSRPRYADADRRSQRWPTRAATPPPAAPTNPIAARCRASMRGSPRPIRR